MSVEIIYRENNEERFTEKWEEYISSNKVTFKYFTNALKYYLAISKGKSLFYKDKSFVYLKDNKPVACVILPIEKREGILTITSDVNNSYVDAPLYKDRPTAKEIFAIIDRIALDNQVKKVCFSIDPLIGENKYNFLQRYGYLDTSILTYFIDTFQWENLKAFRKGHRCDIKKIVSNSDFKLYTVDKDNADYKTHEAYRDLHRKCAGRVTRSKESFDLQYKKMLDGQAVIVGLKYKNTDIAFAYFKYNIEKAIYWSGTDDPKYDKLPIYHALLYKAMEYFKGKKVRYIDVSQPVSPSAQYDYYPDAKQLNIALFKRGFPGEFVQNFRGVKYYSKELFEDENKKFLENYKLVASI